VVLYVVTSFSYFFFHYITHTSLLKIEVVVANLQDVIRASNVLVGALVSFYLFLLLLMLLMALMLSWQYIKRLPFWRAENWWLYPPLIIAAFALIWFKNVDVVRADMYLKDGDRYRNSRQWEQAIALHNKARSIDSDEDFYYLMLALDYQLRAQDGNLPSEVRTEAWQKGEEIAMEARRINPYNPDNTGNMGRYYFTVAQMFNPERFTDALNYFEKAALLAPANVIYHNLWGQTYYIMQDYENAVERLKTSADIDPIYPPTWILLGDTYAAMGKVDEALAAHTEGMMLLVREDGVALFADQNLDQRLNFYISAQRGNDLIAALEQVALDRADRVAEAPSEAARDYPQQSYTRAMCTIGRAYSLMGQQDQAIYYLEQCQNMGDSSGRSTRELANIYLASENFEQAAPLYELLLQQNPNDVEAHSALAFIYARQGRLEEAIQQNQLVLEQIPGDYDSLKNMAVLFQQLGRWQEAINYAQQAQAVAPETDLPGWEQFIADLQTRLGTN
jgi:tetratricopeptide (TPR) repeat protein